MSLLSDFIQWSHKLPSDEVELKFSGDCVTVTLRNIRSNGQMLEMRTMVHIREFLCSYTDIEPMLMEKIKNKWEKANNDL